TSFQLDGQQRDSLIDVVVEFSRDPSTFLFMSFNQPPAYARKSFLGQPAIGDVQARADVASEGTVMVEPWHAQIEDPAKFPVVPPQAILHIERLAAIECACVGIQARG